MPDSIKTTPRKIIALQKHTLKNNAQERMCIYPVFHLAHEKVKWKGEAPLLQGPDTQNYETLKNMKLSLLMKMGSSSYFASSSPHQGPQRRNPR